MQIFVFLQPMCRQERSVFSDYRTFLSQGGSTKQNMRKNMKFWPLNPYYKRSDWKTWLAERISEALTSNFSNKKNTCCRSLQKWREIELYSPPYGFIKNLRQIQLRNSHMKFTGKKKSAIPHEQNYATWFVKSDIIVFSKLTRKISLSVSGEQASKHLASSFLFSDFYVLSN